MSERPRDIMAVGAGAAAPTATPTYARATRYPIGEFLEMRSMTTSCKLVVVGQGYVGLPISIRAVEVGYHVVGVDVNKSRVQRLAAGRSYIEDVSEPAVRVALGTGRFTPSTSFDAAEGFDFAIITVPTPLNEGLPDLSFIENAGARLAPHVRRGSTVVLESTTYPGTTDELLIPILERGSNLRAGIDFHVGYSPERIDPGNATYDFVNTPKVVSGIDAPSLGAVRGLYSSLVERVVPVSSCKVAELTKLLENTFRHVNIALVNELAMFSHDLGINLWEAIDASSTKPFGFMRFTPGPGVGGHCLPVDPSYLSWQVKRTLGSPFRFVELANDVNDHMPDYVVRRIQLILNDQGRAVRGSRVLLLGMAYKRNTSDMRESPATRVAQLLRELGAAVSYLDTHIAERPDLQARRVGSLPEALAEGPHLIVLLTDHDDVEYRLLAGTTPVLDCKNRVGDLVNAVAL